MDAGLGSWEGLELVDALGLGAALDAHDLVGASRVVAGPGDGPADSAWEIERHLVATAVPRRRAEFFAGRDAARAALAELGMAPVGIGRRADRSPDWPDGVIGSLTHTQGLVAAVVAGPNGRGAAATRSGSNPGVGIGLDAEVDRPLPIAVVDRVLDPVERSALGDHVDRDGVVVFSIKEAVFKALNPLTGRWLEFEDVSVRMRADGHASGGSFEARLSPDGRGPLDPSTIGGRWRRGDGLVLSGCLAETVTGHRR
jgi:4'-phosphopantetheinyl transferase EntD